MSIETMMMAIKIKVTIETDALAITVRPGVGDSNYIEK